MSLDHVVIGVDKDKFDKTVAWYLAALAPLNYEKVLDFGETVGLGPKSKPDFWLSCANQIEKIGYFHVAFRASDHATVEAFHKAGVKAGGKSNGEPGIRTMYSPDYYAAFVFDPVGNNVEVVDRSRH